MAKVKISGLANYNDALDATNLGADFLGFYFIKDSPKKVSDKLVIDIVSKLPPFVVPVGIFENEDQKIIAKIVKKCGLKNIQFNGDEAPEFCQAARQGLDVKVFKYFKLNNDSDILKLQPYISNADYFVIDVSYLDGETLKHNFDTAAKAVALGVPVIIAGVGSADIKEAVEKAAPYAIDADSLIERLPKRKDYDKMNEFIRYSHGLK
jgi:phosphoribosylanthranilate isomerase